MSWQQFGRFLRIVFLLRVPLAMLLLLGAFGPLALTVGEELLGNLLYQGRKPWHIVLVSFASFLLTGKGDTLLSTWADEARQGMPALIFNSMIVENGRPLVFTTSNFARQDNGRGIRNFYDLYPDPPYPDVRVNTAVRLPPRFPMWGRRPARTANHRRFPIGTTSMVGITTTTESIRCSNGWAMP